MAQMDSDSTTLHPNLPGLAVGLAIGWYGHKVRTRYLLKKKEIFERLARKADAELQGQEVRK